MLGTALNSHPALTCGGEIFGLKRELYNEGEDYNIEIVHVAFCVPNAKKYIVLVRSPKDRDLSWQKTTSKHFTEPLLLEKELIANPNRKLIHASENQKILENFIKNNDCLVLYYNDLTNNKDIREIPEKYGRKICEYLGVDYHTLKPITYKPSMYDGMNK